MIAPLLLVFALSAKPGLPTTSDAGAGTAHFWGEVSVGASGHDGGSTGSASAPAPTLPAGHWESESTCHPNGQSVFLCGNAGKCPDGSDVQSTWYQADDGTTLDTSVTCPSTGTTSTPTAAPIDPVSELKKVPLPPSILHVQPAGNVTLVNFKTNYYADATPFDTTVTPAGHKMEFKGTATQFVWTFGDGSTQTTTTAGAPYPDLRVTHEYAKTGTVTAHVDTVYTAQYSLDGGPWTPVNGTATSAGSGVDITIREATPVLTD